MSKYDSMKQKELRAACKAAGMTGYSDMKLEHMREALVNHDAATMSATEALNADIADARKPTIQLSDEDKRQITQEAKDRNEQPTPQAAPLDTMSREELEVEAGNWDIEVDADMTDDQLRDAIRTAEAAVDHSVEDDFEAGMAQELAQRNAAKEAADAAAKQAEEDAERNHPMFKGNAAPAPTMAEPKPAKAPRAPSGTSNGLKIEANREERNGVKRPSIGGKCRGIWDMLDGIGPDATAKQAREAGAGKFDKTTIMVQFYRWRKFNGIEGRKA